MNLRPAFLAAGFLLGVLAIEGLAVATFLSVPQEPNMCRDPFTPPELCETYAPPRQSPLARFLAWFRGEREPEAEFRTSRPVPPVGEVTRVPDEHRPRKAPSDMVRLPEGYEAVTGDWFRPRADAAERAAKEGSDPS